MKGYDPIQGVIWLSESDKVKVRADLKSMSDDELSVLLGRSEEGGLKTVASLVRTEIARRKLSLVKG